MEAELRKQIIGQEEAIEIDCEGCKESREPA